mmetsp:Transcript_130329/g.316606  ORF Transcript_130329/g.316606 Transcript_130329/m.316606 type:complete len:209 (+) Transcript_130329:1147-1773(+)
MRQAHLLRPLVRSVWNAWCSLQGCRHHGQTHPELVHLAWGDGRAVGQVCGRLLQSVDAPWHGLDDVDLSGAAALMRVESIPRRPISAEAGVDLLAVRWVLVRLLVPLAGAVRVAPGPETVGRLRGRGAAKVPHKPECGPKARLSGAARQLRRHLEHTFREAKLIPGLQHRSVIGPCNRLPPILKVVQTTVVGCGAQAELAICGSGMSS